MSTRRIKLGTSISSVFVRSATTIGMASATVDQLSGGRFILGLGSSHRVQVEPEHGVPFVQPTQRLRTAFDGMRNAVAFYAGFFPRYNRLLAEAGFAEAVARVKEALAGGPGGKEMALDAIRACEP